MSSHAVHYRTLGFPVCALCLLSLPDLWCGYHWLEELSQVLCSASSLLLLFLDKCLLFCGTPWVLSTWAKWCRAAGHPCWQEASPTVPLSRLLRHQPASSDWDHICPRELVTTGFFTWKKRGNKVEWKWWGWNRVWSPPEWGVIYSWLQRSSLWQLLLDNHSGFDHHTMWSWASHIEQSLHYRAIIRPAPSYWKI